MESTMKPTVYALILSLTLAGCKGLYSPNYQAGVNYATFSIQGDSATLAPTLDAFRAALGGPLNAPNSAPADSGRREINWDGVPAALTNVDTFPAAFFNVNSKRGVVFATRGGGFRVDSSAFASINAALADQFKAFSPKKLFSAVNSNQTEVDFKLVGATTNGLVNGFGVVFSDVDLAGSSRVDYYDANGVLIASVPAIGQSGAHQFSFVGAVFPSPIVARVIIISGQAGLSGTLTDVSAGGTRDLVVMDDFIYGEPQPVQ
jgi:hypothetical protein